MNNFVEDVCALVSIEIERRDNKAWTDEQLNSFLATCEDKDHMLLMLATYVAGDFTAESWKERMLQFWPAWKVAVDEQED